MANKFNGPGLYEFLLEAELQQYYNAFRNDLKVQNVAQLKYVAEEDLLQMGMSRPEMRRLSKYFHKHCPQTYLGKMKKKLLFRKEEQIALPSSSSDAQNSANRNVRGVTPGRHIIQADSIVIHKTLGSGEFGTVQQGVWTSDDGERIQVAIKSLSQERMQNNPVEFLKEAAIMHTVNHEHIVQVIGVVLDTSTLMLVTELAPLRSLLECLKEPSMRQNLSVPTLFDFAVQICDGMQYLESKRLIHRDLAARNILVFSRSKVKISDFGLSRALGVGKDYYQTNFNVNLKLPIAWCAPECINFLRFTTASDVWAYAVTLWEMFTYGFQPWAALTGQQILEAIDEPNFQRLEKPDCCPYEIYNQIMLNCWQHDTLARPTFAQLSQLLPESKPEQVQTLRESECRSRRDLLTYEAGDVITVLDKRPLQGGDDGVILWKGVLKCGKSGLFNPANSITYLGSSLPSVNQQAQSPFHRNDSRSSSMRKGRILSADMISVPQGDLKHTGHMGTDGQFFGDITFLTSKCWVPRQVVSPYKPEPSPEGQTARGRCQLPSGTKSLGDSNSEIHSSDTAPLLCVGGQMNSEDLAERRGGRPRRLQLMAPLGVINPAGDDHEYHEISDEENEMIDGSTSRSENVGLSNPALSSRSQSPLDSPGFDKSFSLGPSLVDEVFGALHSDQHEGGMHNFKSEREMSRHKKKFATVKPISSSDRRTLDQAIAIANELATRSMLDLVPGKHSNTNNSLDDISSPRTPSTPTHRKKFSFILGSGKGMDRERRNYSQEAASIPDIQSTLTEEAKEAYNSLVEKPSLGFLTPTFETRSTVFHFPESSSFGSKKSDFFDNEPLSPPPPSAPAIFSSSVPNSSSQMKLPRSSRALSYNKAESCDDELVEAEEEETESNPLRLLRLNKRPNVLPLPPREKQNGTLQQYGGSVSSRHQRKHPLLIPGRIPIPSGATRQPPPPPPKPQRQKPPSDPDPDPTLQPEISSNAHSISIDTLATTAIRNFDDEGNRKSDRHSNSSFDNASSASFAVSDSSIRLYENIESENPEDNTSSFQTFSDLGLPKVTNTDYETSGVPGARRNSEINEPKSLQNLKESDNRRTDFNINSRQDFLTSKEENTSLPSQSQSEISALPWSPMKVKTVQRIVSNSEEECCWALEITNGDSARAVKLLRLKALLPDSLLTSDVKRAVSVLEMSHWDVARASTFLLNTSTADTSNRSSLNFRSDLLNGNSSPMSQAATGSKVNNLNISNIALIDGQPSQEYLRPTQV